MTADQRWRAVVAFWGNPERREEVGALAIATIARGCRLREKKVRVAGSEQKAKWMILVPELPDVLATQVVKDYLMICESAMLARFLDTLRIPHHGCAISETFNFSGLQPERVREAAQQLQVLYEKSVTDIYFRALLAQRRAGRPVERGN
jgi:hypothetical protein